MFGAFDGVGPIEAAIGEAVLQPVAKTDRHPRRAPGLRHAELAFGDGDAFEGNPISRRKQPCRFPVAAPDITDGESRLQIELPSDEFAKRFRGFCTGFVARPPIAVVNVPPPDFR